MEGMQSKLKQTNKQTKKQKKPREAEPFLGEQKVTRKIFPLVYLLILGGEFWAFDRKRKTNWAFSGSFEKPGKFKCLKCIVSFFFSFLQRIMLNSEQETNGEQG